MIERDIWRARIVGSGAASAWFRHVVGEAGPEEYLQIDDTLYRLAWKQDKMKECEYKLCQNVKTDTVPEPT